MKFFNSILKKMRRFQLEKKNVVLISGFALIAIAIIIIVNVTLVFPVTSENIWLYGLIVLSIGLVVYFLGLLHRETHYLEVLGCIVTIIGELLIVFFFAQGQPFWASWISAYIIIPAATFCAMMIMSYVYVTEHKNVVGLNWSIMLLAGAFFGLLIEAAIREPTFFESQGIPILALIVIAGGFLLYAFTTWKLYEKPSYLMALGGAFIVNIGVVMLETHFKIWQFAIPTLGLIFPALVFFLLIFLNYKISPHD